MFFEYVKAIIYGILEGITEWLPISSTGHLIILERIIPFKLEEHFGKEIATQFLSMFEVVIQLGAILAVLCLYFGKLNPFTKSVEKRKSCLSLWGLLIAATLPAALIGLLADGLCERLWGISLDTLLFTPQVVAAALIVYGALFVLVERLTKDTMLERSVNLPRALAIGFFQALAIIPGTSRSGATILGARILGISRSRAAEFSFFAAIPIIGSASLFKLLDFFKFLAVNDSAMPQEAMLILALSGITAFAISLLTIKFLTDFVKKHSFISFGIYRVLLGLLVLFLLK